MDVIKVFFEAYELDLFELVGAESWPDLFACIIACGFIVFFLLFSVFLPFILFFVVFLLPAMI